MALPDLEDEDVEIGISDDARDVIAEVILSWARFDSAVTQFVLEAFGTPFDAGCILIGNMDTKTKLDRLKMLYQHHKMEAAAQSISNMLSMHRAFVGVRNSVAHSLCVGHLREKPDFVVFTAGTLARGEPDMASVVAYPIDKMLMSADIVRIAASHFMETLRERPERPAKRPLEPPSFPPLPDPNPRKNKGRKPKSQRPTSEA
jgi:hypothetical protein